MKIIHKIIIAVLLCCITASMLCACSGQYEYVVGLDGESCIISGLKERQKGKNGSLNFPSEIDGYEVTVVNCLSDDFINCTSVNFPISIVRIGAHTFEGCAKLTSVNFMKTNLAEIGIEAFAGCTSLSNIVFPGSVTEIGKKAFSGCTSLESISFSGTVDEWNAIVKGENWNESVPATQVVCSDGIVSLQ